MSWFTSGRADGYESNAEHLRDELHRAAGFVRAQLLRFKAAAPEAQRERFWHLPDEQLDAAAGDAEGSPLAALIPPTRSPRSSTGLPGGEWTSTGA